MIEVKNRSVESWGILADCEDKMFKAIINERREPTKNHIKVYEKRQKKLKKFKVSFKKEWCTDQFEIQAESEWEIGAAASAYFQANKDKIGFREISQSKWGRDYKGYDSISYVKVK